MRKILISAFVFCLFIPLFVLANGTVTNSYNTEQTGTPRERNMALDLGTLNGFYHDIEQNLDYLEAMDFARMEYTARNRDYNKSSEDNIINTELKKTIETNIPKEVEILRDRMGKTRNDLIPLRHDLESRTKELKTLRGDLELKWTDRNTAITNVEDAKDALDSCFDSGKKGTDCDSEYNDLDEAEEEFYEVQEKYRIAQYAMRGGMEMWRDALRAYEQYFRGFRAPPVLKGGILPGPKVARTQENPKEGFRFFSERLIPGISNWLLVAIMGLSVIALIVAGVVYVVSTKADLREKALKIFFGTLTGFIVAIMAFAIVRFIVGLSIDIL